MDKEMMKSIDETCRYWSLKKYLDLNPDLSEEDYNFKVEKVSVEKVSVDDCIMIPTYPHNSYYRITHSLKKGKKGG